MKYVTWNLCLCFVYRTGPNEAGNRLLDHGVHGCDPLGDDQGLAVGDIVQGRARVTSQYHLREIQSSPINQAAGVFKITTAHLFYKRRHAKRKAGGPALGFPPLTS